MGCVSTKPEGGETPNRKAGGNSEEVILKYLTLFQRFRSMEQKKEIKTVNDVVAKASDFVITHENTEDFPKFYLLDNQVLGEGAFGRV